MLKPQVTVGIPYTNQGKLLAEAINSVLAQTHEAWELILYGDGPDPETQRIAESYTDKRIRHIHRNHRKGLSSALNTIAEETQTHFLARMDGDDLMHPQRLEKQMQYLNTHPDTDVVGSRAYMIDEQSTLIGSFNEPELPVRPLDFFNSNAFTHPTVMGRTKWFLENKYDETLMRAEDKELWIRTHQSSKFAKLEDRLLYYRVSSIVDWRKQAKDSAFDRQVIRQHSTLVPPSFIVRKLFTSYIKQVVVFFLCQLRQGQLVYSRKYSDLSAADQSYARQTLESLTAPKESTVLAVTVTYGDRVSLVNRTVESALKAGASEVLVIANGTTAEVTAELRRRVENCENVRIHHLHTNNGSATGFHAAIESALGTSYDYYWLLDDDNVIAKGNVHLLVDTLTSKKSLTPIVGVVGVRSVDERHQRVTDGQPVSLAYPPRGSFLYFDAANFILSKVLRRGITKKTFSTPKSIPNAPYGGLLVDRNTVEQIGLPDRRLGLYEDDTEWTSRIAQRGALLLSPHLVIDDIAGKHTHTQGSNGPRRLLESESAARVFFATRNRVLWEKQQLPTPLLKLRYLFNRLAYLSILRIETHRSERETEYASLREAIQAGESGDLSVNLRSKISSL
ncbi:glycosyltransferase family 2 protein [Arthrobacter sunyaminii]|uniref:glycosyltransferase family 2 protein n=1 Tax=Arthrobacter sunyaminii TaxID=2816859 RepID=UPI001A94E5B4|nr:glycosyltransferase [Arthrobacter sunyaminii]MBO0896453.1 glycosyltransferase [Arthrobacter sunyaminii]